MELRINHVDSRVHTQLHVKMICDVSYSLLHPHLHVTFWLFFDRKGRCFIRENVAGALQSCLRSVRVEHFAD